MTDRIRSRYLRIPSEMRNPGESKNQWRREENDFFSCWFKATEHPSLWCLGGPLWRMREVRVTHSRIEEPSTSIWH
jgi:hypothetical protein